jgi:hypothetical protein
MNESLSSTAQQQAPLAFGGDPRRQYLCEQLVFQVIWKHFDALPSGLEVFPMATEVFPSLAAYKEKNIANEPGLPATRVTEGLIEVGDHQGLLDFLNVAADFLPADFPLDEDHLESLSTALVYISAHFQKTIPLLAQEKRWADSSDRALLVNLIEVSERLDLVTQRKAYSPVISPTVAKCLYNANDTALFERFWRSPALRCVNRGALVADYDSLWRPAIAGNLALQIDFLRNLVAENENDGKANSKKLILGYWSGIEHHINLLKAQGTVADWREAFNQAVESFNIDSLQNVKSMITSKQLYPMLSGMANLALAAKESGVEFTPSEYRLAIKPLEKISEVVGGRWAPHMGDAYAPMKAAMIEFFKDVMPADLSKRPLPKHLASALSDLLSNTKWIGKANKVDRGRILDDELGL